MFVGKIIKSKLENKNLILNNFWNHARDFTYIGDVVKILYKLLILKKQPGNQIVNICSNNPLKLFFYIWKKILMLRVFI